MTIYNVYSLIAVTLFALVHLYGCKALPAQVQTQRKYLFSIGGGVAIAYVFIDLLPKLCESDALVVAVLKQYFPSMEKHVYLMALAGFILFYLVDRSSNSSLGVKLSLSSYALFNFLIGYAVADPFNPEVRPLMLFTFALSLHLFVNDNSLREKLGKEYQTKERWLLALVLYMGWITGYLFELPASAVALVSAFIGGGVIMNVTRHELPSENPNSTPFFICSVVIYAIILLFLGPRSIFSL